MQCPDCGCRIFYCKDPEDEYEVYEFCYQDGRPVWQDRNPDQEVGTATEIYCNQCAWHGRSTELV